MSVRKESYTENEDILLCKIYMEISQDPSIGPSQSAQRFWQRVEDGFNQAKERYPTWPERTQRSMQARIQAIEKATKIFHGYIRAAEARNRSGASNADIMNEAMQMLKTDSKYKAGWRFSHVWEMIKNFENFKDCAGSSRQQASRGMQSSDSESQAHTLHGSQTLSSFPMSCDDGEEQILGGSSSSRPIRVKRAKLKKKQSDNSESIIATLEKQNEQYIAGMKQANDNMSMFFKQQKNSHDLKTMKEENKIMAMDLSSIVDHDSRAYFQAERRRILQKRAQQQEQPNDYATGTYPLYFDNIGGSGSGLLDY
ncbi:hypothetical protein SASPL_112403 [Salvia splendens]|uniref:No apical meristem-associated C-terminal domain-containing protein n=2 Tax=Salvia splendens TaxID=180675 RepID=A0A8X8YB58_SALSN|nr:hypothetical protein SASPL_112403 [Salvia splendens]